MKSLKYYFFLALLANISCYGYISLSELSPLQAHFNNAFHVSPLFGALSYELGVILDLYSNSVGTATEKLCHLLFHKDNDQFFPTVARNNPAHYLTCNHMAVLVSCLEKEEFTDAYTIYPDLEQAAENRYKREFKRSSFKRHFNALINYLYQSQKECKNNKYPMYTTHALLVSFLYCRAQTSIDIQEYRNSLFFNEYQGISCSIETLLLDTLLQRNYQRNTPLAVPQGYYSNGVDETVPDCFETVIRELCNALLYNPATHSFDATYIPQTCAPLDDFFSYYTKIQHSNLDIKTAKAGQAWFNLVMDVPGIEYVNNGYEIRPTLANLLGICSHLFGIQITRLSELCTYLSSERQQVSYALKKIDTIGHYKGAHTTQAYSIIWTIEDNDSKKYYLKMNLIPNPPLWHAWIIFAQRNKSRHKVLDYRTKTFIEYVIQLLNK